MAQKPETVFTNSVHRFLPKTLHRTKTNNPFAGGIADMWYSGMADDLWVEYKFIEVPVRSTTVIDLNISPLQHEWLEGRYNEGRNVGVIVGCKAGGVWLAHKAWQNLYLRHEFIAEIQTREQLANLIEGLTKGTIPHVRKTK